MRKTDWLLIGLVCWMAGATVAKAGTVQYESFDSLAEGPITNVAGWEQQTLSMITGYTAIVTSSNCYSPEQSLAFPWLTDPSTTIWCVAIYTNFNYDATNETSFRMSAMLDQENGNQDFLFGAVAPNGSFNGVRYAASNRMFSICEINTGIIATTNTFVPIALVYDALSSEWRFSYGYTNWCHGISDSPYIFSGAAMGRLAGPAETQGDVFIDDFEVDIIPGETWAWWRMDEVEDNRLADALIRFPLTTRATLQAGRTEPFTDPLATGTQYMYNAAAWIRPRGVTPPTLSVPPVLTNWTIEAIVRFLPGADNISFAHIGTGSGFGDTNCMINFFWQGASSNLSYSLRDTEQTNSLTAYKGNLGLLSADERWHHVAMVKRETNIEIYVDYRKTLGDNLALAADGSYVFDTNSHASVGEALNGGNGAAKEHIIDEIRFSTRALASKNFLQPGQPYIDSAEMTSPSNWTFEVMTAQGRMYRMQTANEIGDHAQWSNRKHTIYYRALV